MPDTAVAEPVTASEPEAPLEQAPPETALAPEPETEDSAPPENAEPEAPAFTKADIEAAEKKAAERERGQWQKFDRERAEKAQADANRTAENQRLNLGSQQARNQRLSATHHAIVGITKAAYDAGRDPDPQALAAKLVEHDTQVEMGAHALAHYQYSRERVAAFAEEFPSYRPTVELAQAAERAHDARNYPLMARIDLRMAAEAARQAVTAEATTAAQAEVAARAAQTPAKAPARTVSPTAAGSLSGGGRTTYRTLTEAAAAEADGSAPRGTYKAAKAKGLPFA